ncbi:MAG: type II toxin-antitoxin system VapC family toxin [Planctomycetes bacterium]|nr:type II toxin-antitoxin system VapC family toxin [Planctomycetota bacterium]
MSYLLDTNICSAHIRRPGGLAHRFVQHSGRLFMPAVVLGELYAGAYMVARPTKILTAISELLNDVSVLPFDALCAEEFGRLRGELKRQGTTVNPIDLQVAAVALVHNMTLVTNNTRHFQSIPRLTIEDWLTP